MNDSRIRSPRGRATIVDIAREVGVSPATVSNALNGRRYVEAATGARIKEAAARLGYRPNFRAQHLRTGRADTIALLSSMPFAIAAGPSRLGFLMEVAAVAAALALERGMALVLVPPLEKASAPVSKLAVDGAIVIEPAAGDPDIASLRSAGLPVVAIGRQPGADVDIPYVDLRSGASAEIMIEHLREQSARRIGLVIGLAERNSYIETEAVYRKYAESCGVEPAILKLDEREGEEGAHRAIARLLSERPELDGLCVPVDAFAVGANNAAAELGLRVPHDLKIVTRYDGLRARQAQPPLTALDLQLDKVAALAVDLLLTCIRGNMEEPSVLGPLPSLIPRASSVLPG